MPKKKVVLEAEPGWRKYLLGKNYQKVKEVRLPEGALQELTPPFAPPRSVSPLASLPIEDGPIAYELWREGERVRVVVGGPRHVLDLYRLAYPEVRWAPAPLEPRWVRTLSDRSPPTVFDVEYSHSLPFSPHEVPPDYVDRVVATLPEEAWVQILLWRWDYSTYAEMTASAIQTYVQMVEQGLQGTFSRAKARYAPEVEASTLAQLGPRLSKTFFDRAHAARGVAVHIRAMVRGGDEEVGALREALCGIRVETDTLFAPDEGEPEALAWFRARHMVRPSLELGILAQHTFGRHGVAPWGRGRELIPALLLDAEEVPNLVRLPEGEGLRPLFAERKRGLRLGERT